MAAKKTQLNKKGLTKAEEKQLKSKKKEKNKIVKLTEADVISWLFGYEEDFSPKIIERKTDLNSMLFRLPKLFYYYPFLVIQLNKVNRLYDNYNPLEILRLYRTLIRMHNLDPRYIYNVRWNPLKREKFINEYLDLSKDYQRTDIEGLYSINNKMNRMGYSMGLINLNPEKDVEDQDLSNDIQQLRKLSEELKFKNDERFFQEMSQEIIDEHELTVFDVKLLKSVNEILFIFLDKKSEKRYYKEPLQIDFFYSSYDFIGDNDYIAAYNDKIHSKYVIRDYGMVFKIKQAINQNFDNNIRLNV